MTRVFILFIVLFSLSALADVVCDVTYYKTPVCGTEGVFNNYVITYRPLLMDAVVIREYSDLTNTESKIVGIGSTFTAAWDDAHDVCEKAGCVIQSCDEAANEHSDKVQSFTTKRKQALGFTCFCSYGIGGKWKEGSNSCGGYVYPVKDDGVFESRIGFTFTEPLSPLPDDYPLRFISRGGNISFYLNLSEEFCNDRLRQMKNIPSQAVAYVHGCTFIHAQ